MTVESTIKEDIELLTKVAIKEIEAAARSGNSILFGQLGVKYGPVAQKIYMTLDTPSKSSEWGFFDNPNKGVLLDPWTVSNRTKSFIQKGRDVSLSDLEFWEHSDMIKTLVDSLLTTKYVAME